MSYVTCSLYYFPVRCGTSCSSCFVQFSEALRVYEFKKLLEDTAATASRVATPKGDGAESPVLHTTGGPPASHSLDNLSNSNAADTAESTSDLRTVPTDVFTTSGVAIPRGDHAKQSRQIVERMGGLMDESMRSCQLDYECSCNELNELTRLAKKNGAFGSRVTGTSLSHTFVWST
jgi:galactokinase